MSKCFCKLCPIATEPKCSTGLPFSFSSLVPGILSWRYGYLAERKGKTGGMWGSFCSYFSWGSNHNKDQCYWLIHCSISNLNRNLVFCVVKQPVLKVIFTSISYAHRPGIKLRVRCNLFQHLIVKLFKPIHLHLDQKLYCLLHMLSNLSLSLISNFLNAFNHNQIYSTACYST